MHQIDLFTAFGWLALDPFTCTLRMSLTAKRIVELGSGNSIDCVSLWRKEGLKMNGDF